MKLNLHSFSRRIAPSAWSNLVAVAANYALAYVVYMLCRVAYVLENHALFAAGWGSLDMGEVLRGSLLFDSSAIFYTNALYAVLMLLPLHWKERHWWHTLCKGIYVVVNAVGVTANLADAVYSQFTGRRTTWSFFSEFENEGNMGSIVGVELLRHWYLLLLGLGLLAMLTLLYVRPDWQRQRKPRLLPYYGVQTLGLMLMIPLSVVAMRGGATTAVRPITISNANQYVNTPSEAAIVLNTPFSMIRTIGKNAYTDPQYMSADEMDALFSPLHTEEPSGMLRGRNVVVLIVESFGREYIGFYNRTLDSGSYQGYTPFADSLLAHSLTFTRTFANGRKSIDGMPSILSSIPMFVEPFVLTTSSLNEVGGIAAQLGEMGYSSAFFHGAQNGSMGFQAFARSTGFQHYYGRTEYNQDERFDGDADFDGTWAIWDEPFLQFYALKMSEMQQPFVTALFTASSHHPFVVPQQYEGCFDQGTHPIHQCIGYTDNALRHFFATASQQPWYDSTIFILTSDHTNSPQHDEYRTSLGLFSAPLLIFDPSGTLPCGVVDGVAQQIDIMPTLLSLLGYDRPYVAYGKNLFADTSWAVNYSAGIYQYVEGDYLLLFDGQAPTAFYRYTSDPLQRTNLLGTLPEQEQYMTLRLKAIIQSYMLRMTTNSLVYSAAE